MFKFIKQFYMVNPSTYVGTAGDLTIAADGTNFAIHDGTTPGGNPVTSGSGAPSIALNSFSNAPGGSFGSTVTVDFTVAGSNITGGGIVSINGGTNTEDGTPIYMFDSVTTGDQSVTAPMTSGGSTGYYMVFVTNDAGTGYSAVFAVMNAEPCFAQGTLVTLADGSHKAIEDICYADDLLVWDFDHGVYASSKPIWIKHEEQSEKFHVLTFSDGSELQIVGHHHIFNKAAKRFTHTMHDDTPLGTTTINTKGEEITLVAQRVVEESVTHYNVWTDYHLNMYANGVLTSNRFNNVYPIEDMKFVKDAVTLRSVEEFFGIDAKWITGLRLQEQTAQHSQEYIHWYIRRLEQKMQPATDPVQMPVGWQKPVRMLLLQDIR